MANKKDSLAPADAFLVSRDGEGNLLPVEVEAGGFGRVLVRPMTYGDTEEVADRAKKFGDLKAPDVAKLINKHVVEPDFGDLTGTDVRNKFKAMAVGALLEAIMLASGIRAEVTPRAGGAVSVEFDEGNA